MFYQVCIFVEHLCCTGRFISDVRTCFAYVSPRAQVKCATYTYISAETRNQPSQSGRPTNKHTSHKIVHRRAFCVWRLFLNPMNSVSSAATFTLSSPDPDEAHSSSTIRGRSPATPSPLTTPPAEAFLGSTTAPSPTAPS